MVFDSALHIIGNCIYVVNKVLLLLLIFPFFEIFRQCLKLNSVVRSVGKPAAIFVGLLPASLSHWVPFVQYTLEAPITLKCKQATDNFEEHGLE